MLKPNEILQKYWGYSNFRYPQKEIIQAIVEGKDTLAILPTGGGKSLCYQIPALLFNGMTLVISPLIALMQDQVLQLKLLGIDAASITSQLTPEEENTVLSLCHSGKIKLLYVAPERLQNRLFLTFLESLPLDLIAVDEAHCIAQWGHDFRPSYLKINLIRQHFPKATLLALTATAPPKTQQEIIRALELKSPQIFQSSLKRKNLIYKVQTSQNEMDNLVYELTKNPGSALVFCRTRKQTYQVAQFLQNKGLNASFFHAKLPTEEKKIRQENWTKSNNQVMVATNAFGMGIDKSNVRTVVHLDLPNSLEAYVQEAGRAGRDGKTAQAILYIQPYAFQEIEQLFKSSLPTKKEFETIERMFFTFLTIGENERPEEKIAFSLVEFCQRFNLDKRKVEKTLSFLERKEVFILPKQTPQSKVQLHISPNRFHSSSLIQNQIIECLSRLYPGILSQETHINEFQIARETHKSTKIIQEELKKLHESGQITYQNKEIRWVSFLRPRESDYIKNILWKEFEEYQIAQWKKLQDIIYYASQTEICREKLILHYFGEKTVAKCGECDICKKEKENDLNSAEVLAFLSNSPKTIQEIVLHFNSSSKNEISQILHILLDEEKIENQGIDAYFKKKS